MPKDLIPAELLAPVNYNNYAILSNLDKAKLFYISVILVLISYFIAGSLYHNLRSF